VYAIEFRAEGENVTDIIMAKKEGSKIHPH
jgi:hypothetical protein